MKTDRRQRTRAGARATLAAALTAVLSVALTAAGCADDPFAPEIAATSDAPALQAAHLIGQSPLMPTGAPDLKKHQAPDGAATRVLEMGYQVSLPATAAGTGSYLIRTSAAFFGIDPKGDPVATVDPRGDPVASVDPRDDPVAAIDPRDDPVALVVIALPIDDANWAAIEKAAPKAGDLVKAVVTAELLLIGKDGSETTIDRVTTTGLIDPKNDPASDDDGSGERG